MQYMINLIEKLACLGFVMDHESQSYSQFVLNFNMNKLETTLSKLANMLTSVEPNLKKDKENVMIV